MHTLRARLVAALVAVATAGLLALAGITYVEQRAFLEHRVDDQARAAITAVQRSPNGGGDDDEPGRGRGEHDGGLPLGTYGQHRNATGRVTSAGFLGEDLLDSSQLIAPTLPQRPRIGELQTISSHDVRYRVYAQAAPDGDVTVVAVPLREVDQNLNQLLLVEGLVLGAVLLVLAGVAWVIVRLGLRPLERIGHTAGRIADGELSQRVQETDPRSEVGRLGQALNRMLDRLEEAFRRREASEARLRQFLADASHELRTPLASLRGYAELYRIGAAREPADIDKAMRRIEDESNRMGVLVEDLLTLARLDQVADASHGEVNLTTLARDAIDDARAVAPDRDINLDLDDEAVVRGDAHQLQQVLGNLMRNAIVHTPPGTPIDVTVRGENHDVVLMVRDHGPGLPDANSDAIFERFWRAEGGRVRGKAGAGLGLAIVDGIVRAHSGRVTATNAPGGGACFRIELPDPSRQALSVV
jgi:two-component system, OmpR family, sensor kinase